MSINSAWDQVKKGDYSYFLTHPKEVNVRDENGGTALHFAARAGRVEIMKQLISFNANVNAQNHRGTTPLHLAIAGTHLQAMSLLVEHGADVKLPNHKGVAPTRVLIHWEYGEVEANPQIRTIILKALAKQIAQESVTYPIRDLETD